MCHSKPENNKKNNLIYAKMVKVSVIQNLKLKKKKINLCQNGKGACNSKPDNKKNKFNLCQNGKGTMVNACPRVEPRSAYFGSASP